MDVESRTCLPQDSSSLQEFNGVDGDVHTNLSHGSLPEVTGSVTVNSALESQMVPGKRSQVWLHYILIDGSEFTDGKKRAQCKYCMNKTFIAEGRSGTSNLHGHLIKCQAYATHKRKGGNTIPFDQNTYRELVSKAIIKHGYAFAWVEHEGNREIHAYLNNEVQTISRNTAKSDCLKLHRRLKVELKETLRKVPGRVCLTSDMGTSCQTEGYLCLTVHFVDANWHLNSRVLSFLHIETPHTAATMYSVVLRLLQDWGIDSKIFTITLDNASSNDKMQDLLRTALNGRQALLSQGSFFHVRCAAHVLNLIVKDGLKVIDPIITKVRDSVKYIKWSEARKENFRHCVKLAKIEETKSLWLDVPTRWNSTFMMLDRAILYRDALKELVVVDKSYKHCPDVEEWDMAEKIRCVLEPFYEITNLFSGSDYPTSNSYFENVWKIAMLLWDLSANDNAILRDMGREMQIKFDKYWLYSCDDDYTTLFACAVVLDPRYKLSFIKYCYQKFHGNEQEASKKVSAIHGHLVNLLKEYVKVNSHASRETSSTTSITSDSTTKNQKRKFDLLADYDDDEAMLSTISHEKTILDAYLKDAKLDRKLKLDVLQYWRENEGRYKELSYLARDILTVPLTTVASESTFSIGGRVLNKWRSSYVPENVEALITTRSWLYGYEALEEEEYDGCVVDWNGAQSDGQHCN